MTANKITESAIETFAIELLEKLGYQYVYAPDIAPDSETPERERFEGKTRDTPHFFWWPPFAL
jgi:type I restriction enzyme R subunit